GGLNIQKVKLSNLESSRLLGDPPLATHVTANSSRLLANDATVDKTKIRFSGVFQGTVDTTEMEDNTNEIFVWGTDNLQIFVPDTNLIFAHAATREIGTCAPYSIIKKDQE